MMVMDVICTILVDRFLSLINLSESTKQRFVYFINDVIIHDPIHPCYSQREPEPQLLPQTLLTQVHTQGTKE